MRRAGQQHGVRQRLPAGGAGLAPQTDEVSDVGRVRRAG